MKNDKSLNFNKSFYLELAEIFGLPYYLYKAEVVHKQIEKLKSCFEGFTLLYSLKANPCKELVTWIIESGTGVDAASINEVFLAEEQKVHPSQIYYSAPGKTCDDLRNGVGHCHIIADSINELVTLNEIASGKGIILEVGIRINLSLLSLDDNLKERMVSKSSKFGIDLTSFQERLLDILALEHIQISILHVYAGSQIFSAKTINSNIKVISEVALNLIENGVKLKEINYGGGFGFPCSEKEPFLDLVQLKKLLQKNTELEKIKSLNLKCIIESGRFIVARAGEFITDIVDIKESGGEKYYIVQGLMDQFFRPVFMHEYHDIVVLSTGSELEKVHICGNLCTPLDEISNNEFVPKAQRGDLVVVRNAGAYGKTMSLNRFISHKEAIELLVNSDCKVAKYL